MSHVAVEKMREGDAQSPSVSTKSRICLKMCACTRSICLREVEARRGRNSKTA
jgi:hypothetical protein